MATSIANLNVRISGDSRGFNAAAAGAMRGMKALNAQAKSVTGLSSAFRTVAAQQTALGKVTMASTIVGVKGIKAFNGAMDGTIRAARFAGGAIKSAFTIGLAAIVTATAAVSKFFMQGFRDIDAVSDMAKRLDVSTEALSRLQYAARQSDVEVEALNNGIGKMLVNIQKAAGGSGEAAKALSNIGLSAQQLKSMSPDEALAEIAEGIKSLESPYEQAKAAQDIFGKSGLAMLPMLREGAAGILALGDAAAKTGEEVTALEASRIDAVDKAFKDAQSSMKGLAQTVATELSPYVVDLTKRFMAFIQEGGGLRTYVAPAIDAVVKGVGYLMDGFYGLKSLIAFIRSGITKMAEVAVGAFGGIVKGINAAIEGLNKMAEWAGFDFKVGTIDTSGIDRIKDALGEVSSDYLDEALTNWDKRWSGAGSDAVQAWRDGVDAAQRQADNVSVAQQAVGSWFGSAASPAMSADDDIDAGGVGEVNKLDEAMNEVKAQIAELNQTPIDIKVNALASQLPDELKSQAESYRALLEQFESAKAAQALRDSLVEPIDEAAKRLEEIQKAAQAGLITADEHARLLENLKGDIGEAKEGFVGPSDSFASAAKVGSAESNRLDELFRIQQSKASGFGDANKDREAKKRDEKRNALLEKIASKELDIEVTEYRIG